MAPLAWLADAHVRLYPTGNLPGGLSPLAVARGESCAFQAAYAHPREATPEVVTVTARASATPGLAVRVRRVGYVPLPHFNTAVPEDEQDGLGHVPGFVPDPLFDETAGRVPAGETLAFWFTVAIAPEAPPGPATVTVHLEVEGKALDPLVAHFEVFPVTLQPRQNFPVVQWFYNDALLDWYKLQPFEEGFWRILEPYFRNLTAHGQDTVYAPTFTPPLDGVKRPTQLLRVTRREGDRYEFDWTDVERYVHLAQACGIRNFEWTHFFTQWGVRYAIRIYEGQGLDERLLWPPETGATSATYRNFLTQYLPQFRQFLTQHGLLERSFFHVSDEPHGPEHKQNYIAARALLLELAPWMKTMDALSELEYGREHLTDMPIPIISKVREYRELGLDCFAYFCCGPRGRFLNRLLDTPLPKLRMAGWLLYRFRCKGFLHWGYNYWYKCQQRTLIDPFAESSGGHWPGWAYGDTFVVYPGPQGPLDSLRWEIWAESMQDYALLQTLKLSPDDPRLHELVDFDRYPKHLPWLRQARAELLRHASQ